MRLVLILLVAAQAIAIVVIAIARSIQLGQEYVFLPSAV
jgi:hypothetical protein